MQAVNAELRPLVRMTVPPEWRNCTLGQWQAGRTLFHSVVLLFGVVPVDVHALTMERIVPGRGFRERSHSWCNRLWLHERTTTATASGCVVTDTVTVEGRAPLAAALLMPIYRLVFRHRHRRLAALYGRVSAPRRP